MDIRTITPPKLSAAHIGEKIICYRPKRYDYPNMTVQKIGTKIVAHNYGHGAKGWTLAPGAVNYVNNKMIESAFAADLDKDTPMTIIGAGVIGLFTAYDLIQKGYTKLTIVAERFEDLASHSAGGLVYLGGNKINDPTMQQVIEQISIDSYNFYVSIAKHRHQDFTNVAVIQSLYLAERNVGCEYFVGKVLQAPKDVVLDFGNGTIRKVIAYDDSIFVDVAQMMHDLLNYLKSKRINFVGQKIADFSELNDTFIMSCSGLGAEHLNNDKNMLSVQGHLIMLKDQIRENMRYMIDISLGEVTNIFSQNVRRSFYMFPKTLLHSNDIDIGVIGGTFIEGATDATRNEEEFEILLQGAKDYYGIS